MHVERWKMLKILGDEILVVPSQSWPKKSFTNLVCICCEYPSTF